MNYDFTQIPREATSPITHRVIDRATPADGLTLLTGKPYVTAAQTDVQKTWRKFGWQPREEALMVQKPWDTTTERWNDLTATLPTIGEIKRFVDDTWPN